MYTWLILAGVIILGGVFYSKLAFYRKVLNRQASEDIVRKYAEFS